MSIKIICSHRKSRETIPLNQLRTRTLEKSRISFPTFYRILSEFLKKNLSLAKNLTFLDSRFDGDICYKKNYKL